MERVILFVVINILVASQTLQASLAHLPSTKAHAIASVATSILRNMATDDVDLAAIQAIKDIKYNYEMLANHIDTATNIDDDFALLLFIATGALENVQRNYGALLSNFQNDILYMLALNERLLAIL